MKEYMKPKVGFVELTLEEKFASGSGTVCISKPPKTPIKTPIKWPIKKC